MNGEALSHTSIGRNKRLMYHGPKNVVNFHRRALKYCCFLDRQRKCIVNWLYWYTPEIVSSISTVHSGISDSSCWLYISQHLPWWTQICCASSWLRWKDHYSLVYRKYTSNLCVVIGNIITVWTVNTKLLLTEREGLQDSIYPRSWQYGPSA